MYFRIERYELDCFIMNFDINNMERDEVEVKNVYILRHILLVTVIIWILQFCGCVCVCARREHGGRCNALFTKNSNNADKCHMPRCTFVL